MGVVVNKTRGSGYLVPYCQFNNFYLHIDELLFSFEKDNFNVKYTGRHIIPEYARIEPVSTIVMFSCFVFLS